MAEEKYNFPTGSVLGKLCAVRCWWWVPACIWLWFSLTLLSLSAACFHSRWERGLSFCLCVPVHRSSPHSWARCLALALKIYVTSASPNGPSDSSSLAWAYPRGDRTPRAWMSFQHILLAGAPSAVPGLSRWILSSCYSLFRLYLILLCTLTAVDYIVALL